MTRNDAIAKATKVLKLNPKAVYYNEDDDAARTEPERLEALAEHRRLVDAVSGLEERRAARLKALIASDEDYQAIVKERDAVKALRQAAGRLASYRCCIGVVDTIAGGLRVGHPKAYGANWQALVDSLKTPAPKD